MIFYSLESQCVVGETKVPGDIVDLQICFDDSLDLLALLVSVLLLHDVNNSKTIFNTQNVLIEAPIFFPIFKRFCFVIDFKRPNSTMEVGA